jgi:hypothetical protein
VVTLLGNDEESIRHLGVLDGLGYILLLNFRSVLVFLNKN